MATSNHLPERFDEQRRLLEHHCSSYDDGEEVAQAAIEALGEIGGASVQDILLEMSEDQELENLEPVITEALEESSWSTLDLQFGLFYDELLDEEE